MSINFFLDNSYLWLQSSLFCSPYSHQLSRVQSWKEFASRWRYIVGVSDEKTITTELPYRLFSSNWLNTNISRDFPTFEKKNYETLSFAEEDIISSSIDATELKNSILFIYNDGYLSVYLIGPYTR